MGALFLVVFSLDPSDLWRGITNRKQREGHTRGESLACANRLISEVLYSDFWWIAKRKAWGRGGSMQVKVTAPLVVLFYADLLPNQSSKLTDSKVFFCVHFSGHRSILGGRSRPTRRWVFLSGLLVFIPHSHSLVSESPDFLFVFWIGRGNWNWGQQGEMAQLVCTDFSKARVEGAEWVDRFSWGLRANYW